MADKGPGDLMWEVIETRMTPPVTGKVGETSLQLDRAYKAIAPMTDRPVKIGSISARFFVDGLTNEHYKNRFDLLMDLLPLSTKSITRSPTPVHRSYRSRSQRSTRSLPIPINRSSRKNGSRLSTSR